MDNVKMETPPPYNYQPPVHNPPMASAPPPQLAQMPHVTNVTVTTQHAPGGTCPVCHAGVFKSGFTTCGWLCAICCFPCGIIFCLCCMRQKRCNHCGFAVA